MTLNDLTQEYLQEILSYDKETGVFTWTKRMGPRAMVGTTASHVGQNGYAQIRINRRLYKAHRLAWLYVFGEWPAGNIDHINGVKDDNRISNLRLANHKLNARNQGKKATNTSGLKGVSWNSYNNRWQAQITVNYKKRHLGYFSCPIEAHKAYCQAAERLHGAFANPG